MAVSPRRKPRLAGGELKRPNQCGSGRSHEPLTSTHVSANAKYHLRWIAYACCGHDWRIFHFGRLQTELSGIHHIQSKA